MIDLTIMKHKSQIIIALALLHLISCRSINTIPQVIKPQKPIRYSSFGIYKYHESINFFNNNIFVIEIHMLRGRHKVIFGEWVQKDKKTIFLQEIKYNDSLNNYFYNYTRCKIVDSNTTVLTTSIDALFKNNSPLSTNQPGKIMGLIKNNFLYLNGKLYKRNTTFNDLFSLFYNEARYGHSEYYDINKIKKDANRTKKKVRKLFTEVSQ